MADRDLTSAPEITQSLLVELIDYDPETGVMRWRERGRHHFKRERHWKIWNAQWPGRVIGTRDKGYLRTVIMGVRMRLHRAAWIIVYGVDPEFIDHINGRRADNRIANLRNVPKIENARNQKLHSLNTSGVSGVNWNRINSNWRVTIRDGKKQINVGSYKDKGEAIAARLAAERRYGYHENHGRRP